MPIVVGSTSIFFHYPMKSQNMAGYIPYIMFFPMISALFCHGIPIKSPWLLLKPP